MNLVIFNTKRDKYIGISAEGSEFYTHWPNKAFSYDSYEDARQDCGPFETVRLWVDGQAIEIFETQETA